ncbi:MAG: hypothetical protein Q8O79_07050 [Pseudomonadota bacterium]|nr:hypothetical protein [Pseudomonadota bacterium]
MQSSVSDPKQSGGYGRLFVGLLALFALVGIQGCATHSEGFRSIEQQAAARNIPGAIKALDEFHKTDMTSAHQTLKHLNRGSLLRMQADYTASNAEFDAAKGLMDKLSAISVVEQVGSGVVNDSVKAYTGDGNEQLLVYAFKSLNYLQLGDFDAAAVEARQFDIKHRLITEKYPEAKFLSGAFVRYLNGMVYEGVGEMDSARIEYTKALEGYESESKFTCCGAPAALKTDLSRIELKSPTRRGKSSSRDQAQSSATEDKGEVVFFLHNGLGPSLGENIIQLPNPQPSHGSALLRIALPKFVERPTPVTRMEISSGAQSARSEVVEDINALARKSLEARLPGIQARAVLRLVAKNAIAAEAKKQSRSASAGSQAGALMSLFGAAMDIANIVSEKADTRTWSLLPGNIQLARLNLPPGSHDLKVTYYGANGTLLSTREFKGVQVGPARKTFISDYYL